MGRPLAGRGDASLPQREFRLECLNNRHQGGIAGFQQKHAGRLKHRPGFVGPALGLVDQGQAAGAIGKAIAIVQIGLLHDGG